jgi:hypothetical protein
MDVRVWFIGKENGLGAGSVETAHVVLCGRILLLVLDVFGC